MKQIELALHPGGKSKVEKLQKDTGIKDKTTQYWLDLLYERSKKAWVDVGKNPAKLTSVVDTLQLWLDTQPGDKWNPLLNIPGKSCLAIHSCLTFLTGFRI